MSARRRSGGVGRFKLAVDTRGEYVGRIVGGEVVGGNKLLGRLMARVRTDVTDGKGVVLDSQGKEVEPLPPARKGGRP